MCYQGRIHFKDLTGLQNTHISLLLHTKFAAVAYLAEGQYLHAKEEWVKFLIPQLRTLRLIL
jgi:hypothetical protein